jgi:MtN3 and saliva related transmembrane protein
MADPVTTIDAAVNTAQATGFDWEAYKHYIGGVAATLTTVSFVPQVVQTIRTKDTKAISLGMYIIFVTGIALWFSYGILLMSWPMIISNVITLTLALIILTLKIRHG